jgi:3-hydroxyisobutyrate dehydrogenase/2-hydroxy-3-oxopropionate reductase
MKVGFIGLGNMGQGMADNLLSNGAELNVFTRNKNKIIAMENKGAKGCYELKDLVQNSDLILTCLPDVNTSLELLVGNNGILSSTKDKKIIVDHSTVDVTTSKKCSEYILSKGSTFLDAPISGGPVGAKDATLSIMVGGDKDSFIKAKPFFEMMGTTIKYMGESGTGTSMKLINQLLTAVHTTAAAEALALTNAANVDIDSAMEILMVSFGFSRMLERCAPVIRDRKFDNSPVPARNLHKDISIIHQMGKDLSINLPLIEVSKKLYDEMKNQGKEMDDMAGIIQIIEQNN